MTLGERIASLRKEKGMSQECKLHTLGINTEDFKL